MKVHLTQTMIQKAEIRGERYTLRDDTPGLILRVGASGGKVFYIDYYSAKNKRVMRKLGSADVLTIAQAREGAKEFLARVALGEETDKAPALTLGEFLERQYFPWVATSHKDGRKAQFRLRGNFQFLWSSNIADIAPMDIERWRLSRVKEVKAATINRDVGTLKAAISWGVKRGLVKANPLARFERLQERDSRTIVRYLSPDERERLTSALDERAAEIEADKTRRDALLPKRGELYLLAKPDHIRPMVIISLNTGIRRGALFALEWRDVDLERGVMTLRAETSKSGKLNHVPLNRAALTAFSEWRELTDGDGLVFPSTLSGGKLSGLGTIWKGLMKAAKIENFRWHDMRHDFASQLVMRGVDLNTVRELLGHSDMTMTLRYAHLAPETKAKAVAALDSEG